MHDGHLDYQTINILNQIEWVMDTDVMKEKEPPPSDYTDPQERLNHFQHIEEATNIYNLLKAQPFWLCWQYDSRGRIYSHGHHVNFQSYEYKKAMLSHNRYIHLT
jgi:hypothetical protein